VGSHLIPPLSQVYRKAERRETERAAATDLLAAYAAQDAPMLTGLLVDANEQQFPVIYTALQAHGEQGVSLLARVLDQELPAEPPSSAKEREILAKQQANAAVALLRLNQAGRVWPLLKRAPPDDPRRRSYLVHRLGPLGADAGVLLQRLQTEPDVSVRRALLLSLGEFPEKDLGPATRTLFLPYLENLYRMDSDAGIHAAAEWLLRRWWREEWLTEVNASWAKDSEGRTKRLENLGQLLKQQREKAPPQWYVTSEGQTMVVIPGPVQFRMGSPSTEEDRLPDEQQHQRQIGRTFALAAQPVTVQAFERFLRGKHLEKWFEAGGKVLPLLKKYSPEETCPNSYVDWHRAAAYCNWLNEQEGLSADQWCYETNGQGEVTALKPKYLSLQGYRLPTEAEWEYACRAGAVTSRYYGETEDLLPQYGWYLKNSGTRSWPVGWKKPNDLGLFDMHGNVGTWCQNEYGDYEGGKDGIADDKEDKLSIDNSKSRVLRGRSFSNPAVYIRSASRSWDVPTDRYLSVGVRPARTFTP
jgi:formylglycine-generating enzyme required for sulfatase activity